MPVHDWTRVDAGIFHSFHVAWIPELSKALNNGALPEGFYALAEQHAGRSIADVLTLHASSTADDPLASFDSSGGSGVGSGTAIAKSPPTVRRHQTVSNSILARRRTLAIRHVSGHRLVALIEILSPANKDRQSTVDDFAAKVVTALDAGVHVLIVDLFPPARFDAQGMHGVILQRLTMSDDPYDLPAAEPLTIASYSAGSDVEIYVDHFAAGAALPQMPLFINPGRYVDVPRELTYQEAYRGMPTFWRGVLEGKDHV